MKPIKIAIADDHQLFREGLRFILETNSSFRVIIDASNGLELINALESQTPDAILMDLKMPVLDGVETIKEIKLRYPAIKIIVLTMHHEEEYILQLLDLGANGYLLKNTSSQEVFTAIKNVITKDYYFTDYVTTVMLRRIKNQVKPTNLENGHPALTKREQEILKLICQEFTTSEIAEKLFISDRTVESHRKSLLEKLNSKNTAGLVFRALKFQIIDL